MHTELGISDSQTVGKPEVELQKFLFSAFNYYQRQHHFSDITEPYIKTLFANHCRTSQKITTACDKEQSFHGHWASWTHWSDPVWYFLCSYEIA